MPNFLCPVPFFSTPDSTGLQKVAGGELLEGLILLDHTKTPINYIGFQDQAEKRDVRRTTRRPELFDLPSVSHERRGCGGDSWRVDAERLDQITWIVR